MLKIIKSIFLIFVITINFTAFALAQNDWQTFVSENENLSFDYLSTWSVSTTQANVQYFLINEVSLTDQQLDDINYELEPNQVVISIATSLGYQNENYTATNVDNKSTDFLLGYQIGLMHFGIIWANYVRSEDTFLSLGDVQFIETDDAFITYILYEEKNDGITAIIQFDEDFVIVQARTNKGQFEEYEEVIFDVIRSISYDNI